VKNEEILLLGDINIDTIWPLPEFPIPGRDGLVDDVKIEIGGAVVNSAIALDNLGQKTSLLGCVGVDVWAGWIEQELLRTRIDISHLQVSSKAATGLTFIIATSDGERTMFSHRGANIQLKGNEISNDDLKGASILHISGYALLKEPQRSAVWRAVEIAKSQNIPISLDTGLEPAIKDPEDLRRLLGELTICVSGPEEISALLGSKSTEDAAELLLSAGVQLTGIKLGKDGSYLADRNEQFYCPSFSVNAVDTTGAGDSYSAGLLYGWKKDLSLTAVGALAGALGALAASVYGAGFSLPGKQTIIDFLKTAGSKSNKIIRDGIEEVIACLEK
jgi:ribokinase